MGKKYISFYKKNGEKTKKIYTLEWKLYFPLPFFIILMTEFTPGTNSFNGNVPPPPPQIISAPVFSSENQEHIVAASGWSSRGGIVAFLIFLLGLSLVLDKAGIATCLWWEEASIGVLLAICFGWLFLFMRGGAGRKIFWLLFTLAFLIAISIGSMYYISSPLLQDTSLYLSGTASSHVQYDLRMIFADMDVWLRQNDVLLSGTYEGSRWVEKVLETQNARTRVRVTEEKTIRSMDSFFSQATFILPLQKKISLATVSLRGDQRGIFTGVKIGNLLHHTLKGNIEITIDPSEMDGTFDIGTVYGDVTLHVPSRVALDISVKHYVGTENIGSLQEVPSTLPFSLGMHRWQTPDFAKSEEKIRGNIFVGYGKVTIVSDVSAYSSKSAKDAAAWLDDFFDAVKK